MAAGEPGHFCLERLALERTLVVDEELDSVAFVPASELVRLLAFEWVLPVVAFGQVQLDAAVAFDPVRSDVLVVFELAQPVVAFELDVPVAFEPVRLVVAVV